MQNLKKPKALYWTFHSRAKMRQYGLSEARVRRILHSPNRIEEGIAPKTMALMQTVKGATKISELWVMIVEEKSRRKIISAWRYPGVTKAGNIIVHNFLLDEYQSYADKEIVEGERREVAKKKIFKTKWFKPKKPERKIANLLVLKKS